MSVINATPLLAAAGGEYEISRSVRLRSSASAYFNRTPASSGNSQKFTWSGWVKRGTLTSGYQVLFMSGNTNNDYTLCLNFDPSDKLTIRSYGVNWITSNGVYRDPSAFYHIIVSVDTTQAVSTDRVKLYVNGSQISGTYGTAISQNFSFLMNTAVAHTIGYQSTVWGFNYFDGYLTEVNFIDGQALTPSSFGENDAITGVWKPKKYAGTYGTNGFYLNFSDNSNNTAATIGKDYSGNGNNWTPNNISVTSGVTYDSMLDVPTNYADGGNGRGNYCVLNTLDKNGGSVVDGNLNFTNGAATNYMSGSTIVPTMPIYAEFQPTAWGNGNMAVGLRTSLGASNTLISASGGVSYNLRDGTVIYNGTTQGTYTAATGTTDKAMMAYDPSSGKLWFGLNGTWFNSGNPAAGTGQVYTITTPTDAWRVYIQAWDTTNAICANFGQRPFTYTPPSGFKALNTQNLPDSTIKRGGSYFNSVLYTGNAGNQSITGVGFQPDLVWGKLRSTSGNHRLHDSLRGSDNTLSSNLTDAEVSGNGLVSFDADGFTMDSGTNINQAYTYVAWNWKESATAGFDIVTFTNPSSGSSSFAHNLGVKPSMIITKARSGTGNWTVTHKSLGANMQDYYLLLNDTAASTTSAGIWGGEPTSSVFYSSASLQVPSATMVAYLFSEVAGFSRMGSFTGNGSSDGSFVYCGFRPRFILIKRTDTSGTNWHMLDSARDTYNASGLQLYSNLSSAEDDYRSSNPTDFLSNGFKPRNTLSGANASGGTYIYAAFAENPFKNALAR